MCATGIFSNVRGQEMGKSGKADNRNGTECLSPKARTSHVRRQTKRNPLFMSFLRLHCVSSETGGKMCSSVPFTYDSKRVFQLISVQNV